MKTKIITITTTLMLMVSFSCQDIIYENDYRNVPVYMSYEQFRKSVDINPAEPLKKPGKIYFKDGFIFINEELRGIHVIDNNDPANPVNKKFIKIPGNMDIAIKGDLLYADSYIDLVAIDISDKSNPHEVARVKDVFPYTLPPLTNRDLLIDQIDESNGVVVDWEVKIVRNRIENRRFPVYRGGWFEKSMDFSASPSFNSTSSSGSSFGIGGSMARFGLNGKYLYAVDNSKFHIFDVDEADKPKLVNEPFINNDVETIFILDDHIFIGTRSGMLVYSLGDPRNPQFKTSFSHIYSCDPVVVQNHIAYVTLRGGNECGRNVNRLDILNLSQDYDQATLAYSYDMTEPYGLGVDDDILFLCDGNKGLRIFDISDLSMIDQREVASFSDIKAYDVIPFDDHLFMIGDDGFYQYDYSDINSIFEISHIPVVD